MPSLDSTGARDSRGVAAEQRLLERVRQGSLSAVDALFERYAPWLRQWARGRLPPWVRGAIDTSDLVQDTLHHTFARLGGFKSKQASALRAYLRRGVENRIRDQMRRTIRRRESIAPDERILLSEEGAPQHQALVDDEAWRRHLDGLARLTAAASPPAAVVSAAEAGTDQAAGQPGASDPQVATAAPPPAANGLAAPAVVESPPAPAAAVINPEDEDNAPAVQAARSTQLPPEILVDRRLLRVERLLAADNHQAAHDVMNEIIALEREHDVALPAEFPFRFAQVAFAAGLAETAVEHVNEYLLVAGRDGEFYRAALRDAGHGGRGGEARGGRTAAGRGRTAAGGRAAAGE